MILTNGGRRIATATGAMLADPDSLGNLAQDAAESLFDPEFWRSRGELLEVRGGRGSGGFIARWSRDAYVWMGEDEVRAFAEWRLLDTMTRRGLPVPTPIAARYQRTGLRYRCDLITQRILDAEPLSAALARGALPEPSWRSVGATIAQLHGAGADHADLNAHNILLDAKGAVSVIDFDRGRLRTQGAWTARNLRRLRRSLTKISRDLPPGRFSDVTWDWLMAGYATDAADGAE